MSLINCPECGNEVSNEAVACPKWDRPLVYPAPVIQPKVIVRDIPRAEGFPKWMIAPFVIVGALVTFL